VFAWDAVNAESAVNSRNPKLLKKLFIAELTLTVVDSLTRECLAIEVDNHEAKESTFLHFPSKCVHKSGVIKCTF
jgi:hypothetical protein